jgi:hypothetical protein
MQARGVPEQEHCLAQRLAVVEGLIVREGLGKRANMDHTSHVCMNKADHFEIAGSGENDGIRWRNCSLARIFRQQQDSRADAR